MIEKFESIWVYYLMRNHFVCITTNGELNAKGWAVMGAGNAKQATLMVPGIPKLLGNYIKKFGNVPGFLNAPVREFSLIVFPTKHSWWADGSIPLVCVGVEWLLKEAEANPSNVYHLPRPGCGSGKLDWEREVKPIVRILPDNVWIHHVNLEEQVRSRR